MKKILVIGSLNMDVTLELPHLPLAGETVLAEAIERNLGGKGANQACAVSKLGGRVGILGAIGDDSEGKLLLEGLQRVGVDTAGICVKPDEETGKAFVCVSTEGENTIVVAQGANGLLSIDDIQANMDKLEECDIVMLQMEIPLETISYVVKTASAAGKKVILDPAPATKDFPKDLYPYIDVIKPNETELCVLLNEPEAIHQLDVAAYRLRELGVKNVVVTLGGKGAYLATEDGDEKIVAPYPTEVVDTTAAGDTFIAALAVKLAMGENLDTAVDYANIASSVAVSRKGAQASIPTQNEVEAVMESLVQAG